MKKKCMLLLLAGLLLTGCSENAKLGSNNNGTQISDENANSNNNDTIDQNTNESSNQKPDQNTSENTAESGKTQGEEEAYILNFEAATIDGEKMTSEIFSNSKLTMINVWATYCNPCISEMPALGEIASSYDNTEFQMIGIISDVAEGASEADLANAKDLINQTEANYPHLLLNESLYTNLVGGVDSVPTTFFVNQDGTVIGYTIGAKSETEWKELIYGLLETNR